MVSVSLWLVLPNSHLPSTARFSVEMYSVLTVWSYPPEEAIPFWDVCGYTCCPPTGIIRRAALRCCREEGRLSSASWKDVCTLDDTGFGELEWVSSHRLLVSVLPLAPSCGCCLPPLFSLDGDETEWDSAFSPPSAPPHPRVRCGTSH